MRREGSRAPQLRHSVDAECLWPNGVVGALRPRALRLRVDAGVEQQNVDRRARELGGERVDGGEVADVEPMQLDLAFELPQARGRPRIARGRDDAPAGRGVLAREF